MAKNCWVLLSKKCFLKKCSNVGLAMNMHAWRFSSTTRVDMANMLTNSFVLDAYLALNLLLGVLRIGNLKMEYQVGLSVECHAWIFILNVIRSMHQFNAGATYEVIACLCNAEQRAWAVLRIQRYLNFMFKPVLDGPWPLSVIYWQYFK